jgi:hypothetical protein
MWRIERRELRTDVYRQVWSGSDRTKALRKYDALAAKIQQGTVRLIRPDGYTESIVAAPRLRTR